MKLLLSIAFCSIASLGLAQETAPIIVPDVVKAAFAKQYPNATQVKWAQDDDGYEVSFRRKSEELEVAFSATGEVLEEEMEVKAKSLPTAIHQLIATQYIGYHLDEAECVRKAGQTFYEVKIEKGEQEFELLFSASGELLKATVETEDEED